MRGTIGMSMMQITALRRCRTLRITDPTVVSALWEQDSKYFYYAHGTINHEGLKRQSAGGLKN